jgi:hypothetical protein
MTSPLIHIGYHKTGSTWLQKRVFNERAYGYNQVMPRTIIDEEFVVINPFAFDPKEAASRFTEWFEEADAHGLVPVLSHERLCGKQGTSGVDAMMIADRLVNAFPEGRVLIVIREQRSMMLSVYRAHLMRFGHLRINQVWRKRTLRERRTPGRSLEYFEYHYLIRYYQQLFGPDRVLVLPYEKLASDATGFVGDIARFTGVPAPAEVPASRVNPGLNAGALWLIRYLNSAMRKVGFARAFKGPLGDSRLRRARIRALRKLGGRVPESFSKRVEARWRDEIDDLAEGRFAASNRITADLTGLDLKAYGYDVQG